MKISSQMKTGYLLQKKEKLISLIEKRKLDLIWKVDIYVLMRRGFKKIILIKIAKFPL